MHIPTFAPFSSQKDMLSPVPWPIFKWSDHKHVKCGQYASSWFRMLSLIGLWFVWDISFNTCLPLDPFPWIRTKHKDLHVCVLRPDQLKKNETIRPVFPGLWRTQKKKRSKKSRRQSSQGKQKKLPWKASKRETIANPDSSNTSLEDPELGGSLVIRSFQFDPKNAENQNKWPRVRREEI